MKNVFLIVSVNKFIRELQFLNYQQKRIQWNVSEYLIMEIIS